MQRTWQKVSRIFKSKKKENAVINRIPYFNFAKRCNSGKMSTSANDTMVDGTEINVCVSVWCESVYEVLSKIPRTMSENGRE